MKSKILLIVEGEVEEPRILGSESHGLLSLIGSDYEIVPFASSIYELYEAYKNNEYDDINVSDISGCYCLFRYGQNGENQQKNRRYSCDLFNGYIFTFSADNYISTQSL